MDAESAGDGGEDAREVQADLRASAASLRKHLDDAPPAFGKEHFGRDDVAATVNDAMSALFKTTANFAARVDHAADQLDRDDERPDNERQADEQPPRS